MEKMASNFEVVLNNSFLNCSSNNCFTKNYPDLSNDELLIFEAFLRTCYKKITYRNKESWWARASKSKKLTTDSAKYFEDKAIWHLHLDQYIQENTAGKYINYEIYPGNTAGFIICYYKEIRESVTVIHILSFSSHPVGKTWEDIEKHISKIKYF